MSGKVVRMPRRFRAIAGRPLSIEQQAAQVRSAFTLDRQPPRDDSDDIYELLLHALGKFFAAMFVLIVVFFAVAKAYQRWVS